MTSFTEKAHETFGTQANPILIGDDLAPLGSASNPIVIHVNEGWYGDEPDRLGSDADTEIIATPEFWETLIGRNLAAPVDEGEAVDSSSVRAPTRSLVCEDPEDLRSFEQSTPNCFHFDDKALKVAEISFDASQVCSGPGAARSENVAIGHADGEQSMEKGKLFEAEEPREAGSVPETASMTREAVPQETTVQTDISLERGHPAISTTIGDELAAIYDHVDHCRNADCLHAKSFYDEMQTPRESDTLL
ncbi:hypothetical protein N7539_004056 [Penicillium diatomitis]|uniref:Uncharacterized protein n=1 Tax=Penicillium diatomitis TaxID=2819901 RepID=A0A9W9XDE5_9EURO|nr:uncharacterized protein N7539_004056 [Penicillium diatomitis]KAJ5489166.1 hypothetical protein N7539_004056 [Penicillium diatomitis]